MENQVSQVSEFRKNYLSEFDLYDGEAFITFNIVHIDTAKREIQVAVTNRGRISVITYDLLPNQYGTLYFEYGCTFERIYLDDFKQIKSTKHAQSVLVFESR